MPTAIRNHGRRTEIKTIAPIALDEVLRNVQKESAKVRTNASEAAGSNE